MTTAELSKRTGIPVSNLLHWVNVGWLRPVSMSPGRGYGSHEFNDDNAMQALAIAKIRELFGDGSFARRCLKEAIPEVRYSTPLIRVPECELPLAG